MFTTRKNPAIYIIFCWFVFSPIFSWSKFRNGIVEEKQILYTMSNLDPDGRFQQRTAKNDPVKMQKRTR